MAANRPPDALVAGAIVIFTVWSRRRSAWWLLAGTAVPLATLVYYNLNVIGHVAGAYGFVRSNDFFQLGWSGVLGLLVSPARGLFVFSPFLVFIPVGLLPRLRSPDSKALAVALSFAVVAQILLYSQVDWPAFPNRRFTDPGVDARARSARPTSTHTRLAHSGDGGVGGRADDRSLLVYEDK
jgi:hypothetical protein